MISTKSYEQISDLGYFLPWEIEDGTKNEFICNFFLFTSKTVNFYKKAKINFKNPFLEYYCLYLLKNIKLYLVNSP